MKLHLLAGLICVQAALAQPPAPSAPQIPAFSTSTTLVLVPALVKTKAGEPVFTLAAKDFALTDDGVEQTPTLEQDTSSQPLALVVAVETGGAGARHLGDYRKLGTLIEAIVGVVQHKVAVVAFDSTPGVVQDFTPDLNAVGEAIRELEAGDKGAAILDGLSFSVDLLRRQPSTYRRAILLIGETTDQGSHTTLDEALHSIGDTNTAIYSLGFSSTKAAAGHEAAKIMHDSEPGPPGGCMAQDPNNPGQNKLAQAFDCLGLLAPPLRLAKVAAIAAANGLRRNTSEQVAQLTGGEFFHFSDARSLERDLLEVSHHLPNRYVLSFHPVAPHPGFHAIGLKLKDYPNLVVEARNGYWVDGTGTGTNP
jgi:VWFA-related protein